MEGNIQVWRHLNNDEIEKMKKENIELYIAIERLVNEWDPVGFIRGGAPDDEYDCISVHLINLLKNQNTSDEIYDFIVNELDSHFGMGIKNVKQEYLQKFINKHKDFSDRLVEWYKNYEGNSE